MVATKIVLAVALVSVAIVQIDARSADFDWTSPFENALNNITSKITETVGEYSEYAEQAKNKFNSVVDHFKNEVTSLSKTLDSKHGVTDVVKEATKQLESTVEKYGKIIPEKLNENIEKPIKDLYKKAEEIDKVIKEFTKKQIDALVEQAKSIHAILTKK